VSLESFPPSPIGGIIIDAERDSFKSHRGLDTIHTVRENTLACRSVLCVLDREREIESVCVCVCVCAGRCLQSAFMLACAHTHTHTDAHARARAHGVNRPPSAL